MWITPKSSASYLFPWKLQQIGTAQYHSLIGQVLNYKPLFFFPMLSSSLAMDFWEQWKKSLCAVLLKIFISVQNLVFLSHCCHHCRNAPPHCAPLLPSVTQQQNVVEYWWEDSTSTAISPVSASDHQGQHNNCRRHYVQSSPSTGTYTHKVLWTGPVNACHSKG